MTAFNAPDVQPRPLTGEVLFEEGDFHALSPACAGDAQFNDRRLATRRKLATIGKRAVERIGTEGVKLDTRTSLHSPNSFNHNRVRRIWAYLCRSKAEKKRLRGVLGSDLAKDLDAAYRNAYLCVAIEEDALEISLKLRSEGWYDGQNLVNRIEREGPDEWLRLLNGLPGFRLRLHDWKGEWMCGTLTPERLKEFLGFYTPGEHALTVEQRLPAPAAARQLALGPEIPENMLGELMKLLPLYRYAAWSKESDFLFSS
ncbi:MAG: hypothetical protein ACI8TQ_000016 [Planctomycetota bacterium]|jgi:hypothetical protein